MPLQGEYAGMTLPKHHCPDINYAPKTSSQLTEIIVMMGRTVMQKRENYACLHESVCLYLCARKEPEKEGTVAI